MNQITLDAVANPSETLKQAIEEINELLREDEIFPEVIMEIGFSYPACAGLMRETAESITIEEAEYIALSLNQFVNPVSIH